LLRINGTTRKTPAPLGAGSLQMEAKKRFQKKHLEMTKKYFKNLIQSGNPVVMPFKRLKAAFLDSENP